ncbi:butyrophilin subfamily 1 member A1-like isoform X4 [Cygnus olor]|uniref:butyrophilin subfamily 1 member A1-like isoform X4 n=1 Tax=Cygnus olor TaxID=8869 RepID=UPI001ADE0702|nr:butyrophilin subfamily 1 member A1-like isoform X4 [Cygnus olor]
MGLPWGCGHPSLTSHARGLLTLLVTLLLLRLGSAQLRVVGPDHPLTATVGQDVVLPCHLSPQRDARTLEVRWIRHRLSETVHHYRNGEDLYREQMGAYAGRTELARDGLSAGSLDLRITGLRPSDDGQYVCTVEDADDYDEAIVELEVSATGTDPHLSLGGYEAGGVQVLCRSAGWYPLPQLLWRDARGQHLPSVSQTHSQDQEGLFEIEGAVIVTGSVEGPLSCVVRSSRLQQEWKYSLHIAAPFFHNAQPWMVALALVLVLFALSVGLGVYLFRKKAAKKDAKLVKQAAEIEEKDARLDEQAAELEKQAAELAWRRFLLPHNRVKVTLDPDTAHPDVVVSKNNKSVRRESKRQQVPNTPKRFDNRCCVLGHEEFREGRHCWQVEGQEESLKYSRWGVGVARASVKRKGWIDMSPEEGIWAVQYIEGQLKSLTSPRTPLSLSPFPTRIWVCLDCTQGQVSFINADNGVEIFTFTAASFNGESIRPWFWLGMNAQLCLRDSTL